MLSLHQWERYANTRNPLTYNSRPGTLSTGEQCDCHSRLKGTTSIKVREIDPSHAKETSFTCSLVINWIQKLLIVLECVKDHGFDSAGCLCSFIMVWSHIFTGCSQGGKVTFRNMLCTFKWKVFVLRLRTLTLTVIHPQYPVRPR